MAKKRRAPNDNPVQGSERAHQPFPCHNDSSHLSIVFSTFLCTPAGPSGPREHANLTPGFQGLIKSRILDQCVTLHTVNLSQWEGAEAQWMRWDLIESGLHCNYAVNETASCWTLVLYNLQKMKLTCAL